MKDPAPRTDDASPLLTQAEAAQYLRISKRTLARMTAERRIVQVRMGTGGQKPRILYKRADLDRLIRACTVMASRDSNNAQ